MGPVIYVNKTDRSIICKASIWWLWCNKNKICQKWLPKTPILRTFNACTYIMDLTVGPWADVKNDFTWKIIIVLKVRDGHGE